MWRALAAPPPLPPYGRRRRGAPPDRGANRPGLRWRSPSGGILSDVEGPRAPDQRGTRWHPHPGVVLSAVEGSCPSPRWDGVSSPHRCRPELVEGPRAPNRVGVRWRSPPGVIPSAVEGYCPRPARNAVRARAWVAISEQCGRRGRDPSTSLRMTPAGGRYCSARVAGNEILRQAQDDTCGWEAILQQRGWGGRDLSTSSR